MNIDNRNNHNAREKSHATTTRSSYFMMWIIVGIVVFLIFFIILVFGIFLFQKNGDNMTTYVSTSTTDKKNNHTSLKPHDPCQDLLAGMYPDGRVEIRDESDLRIILNETMQRLAQVNKDLLITYDESCLIYIITTKSLVHNENDSLDVAYYNTIANEYITYYDMDSDNLRKALEILFNGTPRSK